MSNPTLFISHASKDQALLDEFVDLLDTGCGLPRNQIFCTSIPDLGIKPGQGFIQYIKDHLKDAALVILVISPNYYQSAFCLGELGATWVLDIPVFPMVVPPLELSQIRDLLSVTQMGAIADALYLDSLRDLVVNTFGLAGAPTATWTRKRDQFIARLPELAGSFMRPVAVPAAQYELLLAPYGANVQALVRAQDDIPPMKSVIGRLQADEERAEIRVTVPANTGTQKQFEQLKNDARDALRELPSVVREAFYMSYIGEEFVPQLWGGMDDFEEAVEAQWNGYLQPHPYAEGGFILNDEDRAVKDAGDRIVCLSEFLDDVASEDEFGRYFYDEHGYNAHQSLRNKRFWTHHLF